MIGLDLDNTIVSYHRCFHLLASERNGLPAIVRAEKNAVRQFFRESGREDEWTELQGISYGAGMRKAEAFEGALEFVRAAVERGKKVKIISHRTKHPIMGDRTDLHAAAMEWLKGAGFVGSGALAPEDVFFETTKEAKMERIRSEGCAVFLDDLPEILGSPLFPETVEGWLFDPNAANTSGGRVVRDWDSFRRHVL
jgi:hypothetical protein